MIVNHHHLWWPRKWYKTGIERKFRNLPCNVILMSVEIHNMLHHYSDPPDKPPLEEMKAVIRSHENRECGCK